MTTPYDIVPDGPWPTQRRWQDLQAWRLFLGLCLGPILPSALLLGVELVSDDPAAGGFIWILAFFLLAVAWSQITGWIYLLAVARPRGLITRRGCMLFGLTSLAVIPPIALFFAILPGSQNDPGSFLEDLNQRPGATIAALAVTQTACALFGLLSGWLFWRVGVRPSATTPTPTPTPFFANEAPASRGRIFGALLLAAAPTVTPMLASAMTGVGAFLVIVVACLGTWVIGGGLYAKLRKTLRLHECLFLGMVLGCLVTPAGVLLAGLVGQFTNPHLVSVTAPLEEAGLAGVIHAGVIELPFGLIGGWLFWRMAVQPMTVIPAQVDPARQRRWLDLRKGWLIAALLLSAGLSISLFACLSILAFGPPPAPFFSFYGLGSGLLVFELWILALVTPYLFILCRRRGCIRFRDCMAIGIVPFGLFLTFVAVMQHGLGVGREWTDPNTGPAEIIGIAVLGGFAFLPFGVLAGWMFWRIGVRPAKAPEAGVAPVFD